MPPKRIEPSSQLTAFSCPHCGALAKQFWSDVYTRSLDADKAPHIWTKQEADEVVFPGIDDREAINEMKDWVQKAALGQPFIEKVDRYSQSMVINLNISSCFNCSGLALWLHQNLIWPVLGDAPEANQDLPDDVRIDYEEAGRVLNTSPRSAAALLRQAVQRLCRHLGQNGKDIDKDIAALVKNGLDPRVQQALDVVRVIGNNAVHPGQIDLRDDRTAAEKLFGLVNLVADIMISQPKHISAMFEDLPEGARKAIEKRDSPKQITDASGG